MLEKQMCGDPPHLVPIPFPEVPMPVPPPRAVQSRTALRRLATACAATALLAACDQPQAHIAGPQAAPPDLAHFVTGDAAAALGPDGLFSVSAPSEPSHRSTISPERAGELALSYVRSFGPSLKPGWEKDRGAALDLAGMRVVSRIAYAGSPYGAFPAGYHPAFERAHGPYYLVPLGAGAEPELLVAVSAYSTEVEIDGRGYIQRPVKRGNEFVTRGIPADGAAWRMISPEEAVEMVGRATGARAARAPELVRQGMPAAPQHAVWKVTLDREVPVQAQGRPARVRALYVGPQAGRRIMVPAAGGPRAEAVAAIRLNAGENERHDVLQLPIRTGEAISYQPATVQEESN